MITSKPKRRVLIFGGAGFVGSNLADRLLCLGEAHVHIYDNLSRDGASENLQWLKRKHDGSLLKISVKDVRDARAVGRAAAEADEIYHLAAQVAVTTSLEDPRQDFEVNLLGTFNVLEGIRRAGHRPFLLFTSTNKVYGDLRKGPGITAPSGINEEQPLDLLSPYGCSKGAADQYVRDYARIYHTPSVVLRMSCVAGPHQHGTEDQGWVAHFLRCALSGRPVTIYGDGKQVRDVLYVGDLLEAMELIRLHLPVCAGQIYNIGGGAENTVSLLELMQHISTATGKVLQVSFAPGRTGDQPAYVTDYGKLHGHTGWRPTTGVAETLIKMQQWLESKPALAQTAADETEDLVAAIGTELAA
jgi:CDP-paratose 2-epimerase